MNILDYDILLGKLESLKNLEKKESSITRFGYEIPYYTYGNGNKNIIFVGGTHGSEIISVDFVLNLMDKVSNKKDIFSDIDENEYTFHFIPVQNPEGFIVSTCAIRTLIPKNMKEEEVEKICKEYYEKYRMDDINAKENPNDKSIKLHQKMFENADYTCIDEKHKLLKSSIKEMYKDNDFPRGSLICFRPNGSGVELNRNTRYSNGIKDIKEGKTTYGLARYNNIITTKKGPIGIPCYDINNFDYEIENKFLYKLIDNLYVEDKFCGAILFHGTGGEIYYKPIFESYENKLSEEEKEKISSKNLNIALKYQEFTNYRLADNKDEKFNSFDGYLRTIYPAIILIELSKMGGNPIAPYGDIKNNYIKTMDENFKAVREIIKIL